MLPAPVTYEDKLRRLAALKRAQEGVERFEDFVHRIKPEYWPVPRHLQPLYDLIERSRHEPIRALISMPPRHGKTETLRLGLTYRNLYDPVCQNAYATFGSDLSEETGRIVRETCKKIGVKIGGTTVTSSAKAGSAKVLDWKTYYGGGLKSTSVGGSITGRGINGLLIIDDPIKGHEAAMSLAERNRVWRWLRMDILSRLEGGASCIIVQTRWHEDDPIGRMLEGGEDWEAGLGEEWIHINLAAVGDEDGNPVDEKLNPELAQPLWPSVNSRYPNNPTAAMDWYRINRARGEYEWWALYQGVPRSVGRKVFGDTYGMFQMPMQWLGKRGMLCLDPAATAKTSSNYSALGAFAMDGIGDDSRLYVARTQKFHDPVPKVLQTAYQWQLKYKLVCGVETVGGFAMIPDIIQVTVPKLRIIEITTGGKDKYTRAIGVSKAWNDSRVLIPNSVDSEGNEIDVGWDVEDYLRVMQKFTGVGDAEDDLVDITAHAWNRMYKPGRRIKNVRSPAY